MNIHLSIIFAPLAAAGAITILTTSISRRRGLASADWPAVRGTIAGGSLSYGESSTRPIITYHYEVDHHFYTGSKICFGTEVSFLDHQGAQAVLDRYPPGSAVQIYYDPVNPRLSVLEPGLPKTNSRLMNVGIAMAIIGGLGTLIALTA